jgi:CheY-like chemotaxis protein
VTLTTLVCGLGADAHAALGLRHAIEASRICRPHVLLCDVPPLVAGIPTLVHHLRREGVIVPTVALAASVDAATREAARSAGFSAVLPADATSDHLSDAILTAVG